jgi:hypothetical protein
MDQLNTEQRSRINAATKRKTSFMIRMFRIARDNPDLFLLLLCFFSALVAGWFAARFWLGLTANEIKTEIVEAAMLGVWLVVSVASVIGNLFAKQGTISSTLSGRMESEHDATGNSIVPR